MPDRVLTARELNRATLARQLLLERHDLPVADALRRVGGLQAQVASTPPVGLWTRLAGFRREALTDAAERREAVRAAFVRSTLHVVAGDDFTALWGAVQPALLRALAGFFGERARGLDVPALVAAARQAVRERPRPQGELRALLAEVDPAAAPEAMAYAVRAHLPLVQVPDGARSTWSPAPAYADAEDWLGRPVAAPDPAALLRHYLAAFGPATVRDAQTWSGVPRLAAAADALAGELVTFRGEAGERLLDLPGMPLPPADARAPARLLPEYDNVVLGHADRTRLLPERHRGAVSLPAGRVRATFLVDGTVAGVWRVERSRGGGAVVLEPFGRLAPADRDALLDEAAAAAVFLGDGRRLDVRLDRRARL